MEFVITDEAKVELDKLYHGRNLRIHPKNKI